MFIVVLGFDLGFFCVLFSLCCWVFGVSASATDCLQSTRLWNDPSGTLTSTHWLTINYAYRDLLNCVVKWVMIA